MRRGSKLKMEEVREFIQKRKSFGCLSKNRSHDINEEYERTSYAMKLVIMQQKRRVNEERKTRII